MTCRVSTHLKTRLESREKEGRERGEKEKVRGEKNEMGKKEEREGK